MSEEVRVPYYGGWGYREGRISRVLDELRTHNEVKVGDAYVVRIPKIQGKILIDKKGRNTEYVVYIYENWYDSEKKQNRNHKICIGQVVYAFPGAMLPNENYYRYFDRVTGEEKKNVEGTDDAVDCSEGSSHCADDAEETGENAGSATYAASTTGPTPCAGQPAMKGLTSREQRAAIQRVMEDEGIIKRGPERLREAIRERAEEIQKRMEERKMTAEAEKNDQGSGENMTNSGEGAEGMPSIQMSEEERKRRRRLRVLLDVLTSIRDVVKEQARRRPDEVMNAYQVEKINPVLEEIIRIEKEMGFGDLLETIRKTEKGADGKVNGMSYSDIEVLLEYFNSVVWFTQSEMI